MVNNLLKKIINSNKITDEQFSESVDLAKGIGIVLVVVGHIGAYIGYCPKYLWVTRQFIFHFHMPLFMFLSGLLMAYSEKAVISKTTLKSLVKKKFQRLLVPYITISLIFIALKWGSASFLTFSKHVVAWNFYDLLNVFIDPSKGLSSLLWFLYSLFTIFVFFALLRNIVRHEILILVISLVLMLLSWPTTFCLYFTFRMMPYFVGGWLFYRYDISNRISPMRGFFISALLFSLVSSFAWGKTYFTASPLLAFFFALSGSLSCIFLSHLLSRSSYRFKLLRLFGVYAGPIYLLHIPVIWFVGVPWFRIVKPKEPVLFISIIIVILAD